MFVSNIHRWEQLVFGIISNFSNARNKSWPGNYMGLELDKWVDKYQLEKLFSDV